MSISVRVKVHTSGEEFFAREGTYEKNKDGKLVPGYYIITPIGDRWIPCTECSAVSINGYPISKEVPSERKEAVPPKRKYSSITANGGRATVKNHQRKGADKHTAPGAEGRSRKRQNGDR